MRHDDDWLEDLLRRPAPYIEDLGFSARVVSALPAPTSRVRRLLLLSFSLAAALLVLVLPPLRASLVAASDVVSQLALAAIDPKAAAAVSAMGIQALVGAGVLVVISLWGAVGLARARD